MIIDQKKKKYSKSHSTGNDDYEHALTERESSLGRWGGFENEQNQINGSNERLIEGAVTDRSVINNCQSKSKQLTITLII
jgi:hypothetical protein